MKGIMENLWLKELQRLVKELSSTVQSEGIRKDTPLALIVNALEQLVGTNQHSAFFPKAETVKSLAQAAMCEHLQLFQHSDDEQALRKVNRKLKSIVSHCDNGPRVVIAR